MIKVGIVDDDQALTDLLADEVEQTVLTTDQPGVALEWVREDRVDCLFTDLKMQPMDGLELLEELSNVNKNLPVVMITGHATVDTAVEAMKKGADDYVQKPLGGDEFQAIINRFERQVNERRQLAGFRETQRSRENQEYRLVGSSSVMENLRDKIKTVAPQPLSVLVKGETGTGKEIIARQIHAQSDRSEAPLLTVNCAAIPENLLEEELFGHQKGAFTGADETRKGKLELADGGTVFLDEIGELPLNLQPKLLRVLEQKEVTKVGGDYPRVVDVRFIAASNRNLQDMVEEDRFRKDLFYRLNSFELQAPPLREHSQDIPELAEHFLNTMAERLSSKPSLTEEALEELQSYSWPGNVRELKNLLERSAVLAEANRITVSDLPEEITGNEASTPSRTIDWKRYGNDLDQALDEIESRIIERTLDQVDNKAEAARRLGISRQSLQYKLDN